MTFTLTFETGNADFQTYDEDDREVLDVQAVADAVYRVADAISEDHLQTSGTVRDLNGNTVGTWKIE